MARWRVTYLAGSPITTPSSLPIGLFGAQRDFDVVVGPMMALEAFRNSGLRWHGHVGLGGVVRVVQTDANDLPNVPDAGSDAWRAFDEGQFS